MASLKVAVLFFKIIYFNCCCTTCENVQSWCVMQHESAFCFVPAGVLLFLLCSIWIVILLNKIVTISLAYKCRLLVRKIFFRFFINFSIKVKSSCCCCCCFCCCFSWCCIEQNNLIHRTNSIPVMIFFIFIVIITVDYAGRVFWYFRLFFLKILSSSFRFFRCRCKVSHIFLISLPQHVLMFLL